MSKKKLLNEAQVRRFMGLAGMKSNLVSNYLKEGGMYYEEEEDMADAEAPMDADMEAPMDAEEPMADEPEMDAMDDMDAEEPAEEGDMDDVAASVIDAVAQVFRDQGVEIDVDGAGDEMDEPEMPAEEPVEEPAEEPEMDAEEPAAEDDEELLEDVSLELTEEEIVQEVARRVAARIIKAQKAEKAMNEALARKSKARRKVNVRRKK